MAHAIDLSPDAVLPAGGAGLLIGRAQTAAGPIVVRVDGDMLTDLTATHPTVADLLATPDPAAAARAATGPGVGALSDALANSDEAARRPDRPFLLAPIDLQAVKAAGVTFIDSLLERLVEELSRGDAAAAAGVRDSLGADFLARIRSTEPGSPEAAALKTALVADGRWSQYLEVGLGPDAEIFTKAQPLSSVGLGATAGVHPRSEWSNPEPEIVLILAPDGRIVGASLGDDVNLRDVEGRSALLLGRAKDNNAASVIGPFIRLFERDFTIDSIRSSIMRLQIDGEDGFSLDQTGDFGTIARPYEALAAQCFDAHAYPDGAALYTGTPFAPTQDRGATGMGFTFHAGDVVRISTPELGALVHRVGDASALPPWRDGARALYASLAARRLL